MKVVLLKAHVSAYTKKDGTFVAAHEDGRPAAKKEEAKPQKTVASDKKFAPIKSSDVKNIAEDIADKFRKRGFNAEVTHSGSAAGASSYIRVNDPQTWRFFNDEIRVSDHSKGSFNSQFYYHINDYNTLDEDVNKLLADADAMRAKGKSLSMVAAEERQSKEAEKILRNARKKLAKGKPLARSEEAALREAGELTKSYVSASPTPAQAAAGNYKKRRIYWRGFEIAIEQEKGSVRSGVDPDGNAWSVTMKHPYGYLRRTLGVDGDQFDCFLGPDIEGADTVYVITTMTPGRWKEPDEQKAMIGFKSEAEARAAFKAHYDDDRFMGAVKAMPVAEFVKKARGTKDKPVMIKGMVVFLRAAALRS